MYAICRMMDSMYELMNESTGLSVVGFLKEPNTTSTMECISTKISKSGWAFIRVWIVWIMFSVPREEKPNWR